MQVSGRLMVIAPRYLWTAYFVFSGIQNSLAAHAEQTPSGFYVWLMRLTTAALMSYTIYCDSLRRTGAPWSGYCTWSFLFWPILGPVYLFETRRWRGLGLAGLFLGLFTVSFVLPPLIFAPD